MFLNTSITDDRIGLSRDIKETDVSVGMRLFTGQ